MARRANDLSHAGQTVVASVSTHLSPDSEI